jgi:hypothetical protein
LSDIIRADIIMGATGPSAQIMSDQITSDKVDNFERLSFAELPLGGKWILGDTVAYISICKPKYILRLPT